MIPLPPVVHLPPPFTQLSRGYATDGSIPPLFNAIGVGDRQVDFTFEQLQRFQTRLGAFVLSVEVEDVVNPGTPIISNAPMNTGADNHFSRITSGLIGSVFGFSITVPDVDPVVLGCFFDLGTIGFSTLYTDETQENYYPLFQVSGTGAVMFNDSFPFYPVFTNNPPVAGWDAFGNARLTDGGGTNWDIPLFRQPLAGLIVTHGPLLIDYQFNQLQLDPTLYITS